MKYLKGILIFCSGALAGGGGMYYYMKSRYDKTINDALAEVREEYYNKTALAKTEKIIEKEGYLPKEEEESKDRKDEKEVLVERIEKLESKPESPREDYPDQPIIITEDDFAETELYFEKQALDYYVDDGALVDENEELVNVDDTIGFDNLDEFLKDEDLGTIHIRNGSLGVDYEVTKLSGSYSEIVGIGGDDDED